MKRYLNLITTIFFICLMHQATAQGNYVSHTLKTGESLSLLAKQYNTNVGDIMRMNGMHADTKLVYGSVIKIPSTKANIAKAQPTQTVEQNAVAVNSNNIVKHTVVKGETLFSISKKYNVSVAQLKAWNNLSDNSAKLGSSLIVGSANSTAASVTSPDTKRQRVETTQPTEQTITQKKTIDQTTTQQEAPVVNTNAEEKKDDPVVQTSSVTTNTQTADAENNNTGFTSSFRQTGAGFFEEQYSSKNKHKKHISGISKTFKTNSGWSDGKYYILADNIDPGTIVKLTADNGKSVYAKVLWNMGDLKENNAIDFRVSNATAAALNESDPSFNLTLNY